MIRPGVKVLLSTYAVSFTLLQWLKIRKLETELLRARVTANAYERYLDKAMELMDVEQLAELYRMAAIDNEFFGIVEDL